MSIDKYFERTYNRKRYNCAHLVCEVWKDITGEDLSQQMRGFFAGSGETTAIIGDLRNFQKLLKPVSPCIVLFQSPRMSPHVGMFIRGRVLHIQQRGVEYQPLDVVSMNFKRVSFYQWLKK